MSMKAKAILLTVVILLCTEGLVQAGPPPDELGITLDATWSSRFIWRGFDWFSTNDNAFLVGADVDFWGTGFGANITWVRPIHLGHENYELIVYNPYYGNTGWQGEPYQMNYRFGWQYYNAPDGPVRGGTSCSPVNMDLDWQVAYGHFSWPNVCPYGFVPWYEYAAMWPDEGGTRRGYNRSYFRQKGGFFHTFGFNKDWTVPGFLPNTQEQVLHTSFAVVYNDGAGPTPDPRRNNADHDFSHCVAGVSTDILLSDRHSLLTFSPGFYYQSSWEDSVNTSDEYWFTLSLKYQF
jgi:hypothetical protein